MLRCKWKRDPESGVWETDCGRIIISGARPEGKRCYCGRRVEYVGVDRKWEDKQLIDILREMRPDKEENE